MERIGESHSGDLLSRMTNDIRTAENAYGWQLAMLLMALLSGIGSIAVILSLNWKMAGIGIAIGAACALLNAAFAKPIKKASDGVQRHLSDSTQALTDILAGDRLSRIFNLNQRLFAYFASANLGVRDEAMKRTVYQSLLNGMNGFVNMAGFMGILIAGSIMALNHEIPFSQIIPIVQMMNGITWMFTSIGNFIAQLQGSLAGADRIFEILDAPVEASSGEIPGTTEKPPMEASAQAITGNTTHCGASASAFKAVAISFRDVSFSYEADRKVLDRFHADIEQNKVTAFVGMSGSGKSTLFRLLLGFYRPDSGDIRIFNRSVRDYSLQGLRSRIAYVPQESYLFSGTIRENIGYGGESRLCGHFHKGASGRL
jgi:ATP-binding cassette subfamily B protein